MSRLLALPALALAASAMTASAVAQDGQPQSLRTEPLEIATHGGARHFTVEIADHPDQREIGMMYRRAVAPDHGMLFEFNAPAPLSFWMKNTYVPLDIVFIGMDGRVVNIASEATPLSEAPIPSSAPAVAVLELRGGRAAEIGLQPGDVVHAKFFHN